MSLLAATTEAFYLKQNKTDIKFNKISLCLKEGKL